MTLRPRQPARRRTPTRRRPAGRSGRAPARRTRSVRRASAGLTPVRAGALLAMLSRPRPIYGVAPRPHSTTPTRHSTAPSFTDEAAVDAALDRRPRPEPVQPVDRAVRGPLREAADRRAASTSRSGCRTRSGSRIGSGRRSWSGRSANVATWSTPTGSSSRMLPARPPAGRRHLPVVEDRRAASVGLSVGQPTRPRSTSMPRPASARSARPMSAAPPAARGHRHRRERLRGPARAGGWAAVFGFYTPSLRTPELIPGQVRLLRSLLDRSRAAGRRVILASETDGTYIPSDPAAQREADGATSASAAP